MNKLGNSRAECLWLDVYQRGQQMGRKQTSWILMRQKDFSETVSTNGSLSHTRRPHSQTGALRTHALLSHADTRSNVLWSCLEPAAGTCLAVVVARQMMRYPAGKGMLARSWRSSSVDPFQV